VFPDDTRMGRLFLALLLLAHGIGTAHSDQGSGAAKADGFRLNIRALIHRQTEQEARNVGMRALAGTEATEAVHPAPCQTAPDAAIAPFRGQPLIRLVRIDEITQVLIPRRPGARTGQAAPADLTDGAIEAVLLDSRIDRYENLGAYHLAPGHHLSVILKDGNRMDVHLYVAAPIGSAIAPDGCRYWFTLPVPAR
jgi:hypothetical protein